MNPRRLILKTISTFLYIGYLPWMPGTFGSIAGLCLFYLIKDNSRLFVLFIFSLIFTGFLVAGRTAKMLHKKDPECIVIDEVSGIFLSLAFIPYDIRIAAIGFFLFRVFDILKPYPISDIQEREGSIGIMGDDIVAGMYTNAVLQLALRLASLRGS